MRHQGATRISPQPSRRTRTAADADVCSRGTSMSALAAHLVGRHPELARLDAALDELDGRRSRAIEIVGAAGIGKTRLLAELAARADARGHIVLAGAGAELERDLPFWVFVDALDEYLEGVDPGAWRTSTKTCACELAHVFPRWRTRPRRVRGSPAGRALPDQSRGARAARTAGGDQAAGARPRRLPLGRPGVRSNSSAQPAASACRPPPCCSRWRPGPTSARRGWQRSRAGAARRRADAHRARAADQRRSRRDARA